MGSPVSKMIVNPAHSRLLVPVVRHLDRQTGANEMEKHGNSFRGTSGTELPNKSFCGMVNLSWKSGNSGSETENACLEGGASNEHGVGLRMFFFINGIGERGERLSRKR